MRGLFGLPGHEGGIDLGDGSLLCAESAADAGFGDADHRLGNAQRVRDDAAAVEDDLRRGDDEQSAISVDGAERGERLHHRLLARLGVIDAVDDDVGGGEHRLDVPARAFVVRAEVALVVRADGTERFPVFLGVDEDGIVLRRAEIQYGGEDVVFDLDELHRLEDGGFRPACDDGDDVADEADMPVEDEPVVRAGLGVRLPRAGEAVAALVDVFVGKDRLHTVDEQGAAQIDVLDLRVGVRRAQQFYDETILGRDVVGVDGLTRDKLHGVFFADGLIDLLHR